jgi:hypothetical protein
MYTYYAHFQLMTIELANSELTQISNLLVTLNSSVNFIIYCIFGEKFKRLFCHMFCGKKWCCFGAYVNKDGFPLLHRYTTTNATLMSAGGHGTVKKEVSDCLDLPQRQSRRRQRRSRFGKVRLTLNLAPTA